MPTTLALRPTAVSVRQSRAPSHLPWAALNGALLQWIERVELWTARRSQRLELLSLPDHLLRDIGHSRADVEAEATKPFWRA